MMIYCVAIAGIWQTSGFVMAMFLAGLRGVDGEILKAAQIDGASAFATYRRIVLPIMRPVFLSALIILTHMAIKSYDLVLSVTGKNPGGAAELPSTFMYSYTFTRNQMAVGSASAVIMLRRSPRSWFPISIPSCGRKADERRRSHHCGAEPRAGAAFHDDARRHLWIAAGFRVHLSRAARRDGDDVAEAARRGHWRQYVRAAPAI